MPLYSLFKDDKGIFFFFELCLWFCKVGSSQLRLVARVGQEGTVEQSSSNTSDSGDRSGGFCPSFKILGILIWRLKKVTRVVGVVVWLFWK